MLCSIFILLDEMTELEIRRQQRILFSITGDDTSLRFPVHITVRGRFCGEEEQILDRLAVVAEQAKGILRPIVLEGPLFQKPAMVWQRVGRGTDGFSALVRVHDLVERVIRPVIAGDEVPACHKGVSFTPHTTLTWRATPSQLSRCRVSGLLPFQGRIAIPRAIALASYPINWRDCGQIEIISSIPSDLSDRLAASA
jgi:hypothetical protein